MLITSSVIEVNDGGFAETERYLAGLPNVEVRGISEDKRRILLIIETEDGEVLEKISAEIGKCPGVFSLLHHSFHFDEDE
ncbi:MAG: chaperone NapD [Deferribacteraceae bacterium]|jgi:nitrate reductase NapAB chaperone NapD|nr:chaperone NapD [Deferribacteraceae bacterium]